jgi:hypothetical protein
VLVDGKSNYGGNLEWDLPKNGKPGKWHSVKGKISQCNNGLHLTTKPYEWFQWKCDIYIAEGKGSSEGDEAKTAFRSARLIKKTNKPKWLKDAETFVDSIKKVKWFSNGKLPKTKKIKMFTTRDVARDAARNAARDAAGDVVGNAARNAARDAAGDVVGNAARDVAWDVAGDVAGNAARDARLMAQCLIAELTGAHLAHSKLRWSIWESGYGVYCDVNDILYCYKKP